MKLSSLRSSWIPIVLLCVVALLCPFPWDRASEAAQSALLIAEEVSPPDPVLSRRREAGVVNSNTQDCNLTLTGVGHNYFTFEGGEGSFFFVLSQPCAVKISSAQEWINVRHRAASESGRVAFVVEANDTTEDRVGTITISNGSTKQTLTIHQGAGFIEDEIVVTGTYETIPPNGGQFTANVQTRDPLYWIPKTPDESDEFIDIEEAAGKGNGQFNFTVGANTGSASRTGTISVLGTTVTFNQPGGSNCPLPSLTPRVSSIGRYGGSVTLQRDSPAPGCFYIAGRDLLDSYFLDRSIDPNTSVFEYALLANESEFGRNGDITFNGQPVHTYAQAGTRTDCPPQGEISPGGPIIRDLNESDCFRSWGGRGYSDRYTYNLPPNSRSYIEVTSETVDTRVDFFSQDGTRFGLNDDNGLDKDARFPQRARYHAPTFCGVCRVEVSSSNEFEKGSYGLSFFLSTEPLGSHDLSFGYDTFDDIRQSSGGPAEVTVNAAPGFNWEAESYVPWITITNGGPKTGPGKITFTVSENLNTGLRVGEIGIPAAEKNLQIKQYGTAGAIVGTPALLQRDDGTANTGAAGDNLDVVTCLTPPSYPFTATSVAIHAASFQGQSSPVGKSMSLYVFWDQNLGRPPQSPQYLVNRDVTIPGLGFNIYNLPEKPTITSGSICVGVRTPTPANGVIPSVDTDNQGNSYFSRDNANNFSPLVIGQNRTPGNFMARINGMSGIGGTCASLLSPSVAGFNSAGGTGMFNLTTGSNCFTAFAAFNPFINLLPGATGTGPRQISFGVAPNTQTTSRFGLISGAGQTVRVKQGPQPPCPVVNTITPQSARIGREITFTGNRLLGLSTISFANQIPAPFTIINDGLLRLTIPDTAVSGPLLLTTPGCAPVQTSALNVEQILRPAVTVSAANYGHSIAADMIAAVFLQGLSEQTGVGGTIPLPQTLNGASGFISDASGTERPLSFFFVSPGQANVFIPPNVGNGLARIRLFSSDSLFFTGNVNVSTIAPGVFSADGTGTGPAAALALRIKQDGATTFEPVVRFDPAQGKFVPIPIDLRPETDRVFLILYGTGIRRRSGLENVSVSVGGTALETLFAGEVQGFVGLDQVNTVQLPRALAGRGEGDVVLRVDGQTANTVKVAFR
jgi:uncharacterized protein (TIGR03437 family)